MNRIERQRFVTEIERDRRVFSKIWDLIQQRDREVEDTEHYHYFSAGPTAQALRHVLNMGIMMCDWLLEVEREKLKNQSEDPKLELLELVRDDDDRTNHR